MALRSKISLDIIYFENLIVGSRIGYLEACPAITAEAKNGEELNQKIKEQLLIFLAKNK